MLDKEQIVVLHTVKHSDTGLVVSGYSNRHGKASYYYYASKKNAGAALLSPLSILDTVVFYRHAPGVGTGLPLIKEISPAVNLHSLKTDLHKTSIALYMCELLDRGIKEIEPDCNLYQFVSTSVQLLDALDDGVENFHLYFTANLCRAMGYMPQYNYSTAAPHFNFTLGEFVGQYNENYCFPPDASKLLSVVLSTPISELKSINCSGKARSEFLGRLLEYLEYHTQTQLHLKSLAVLGEIFK